MLFSRTLASQCVIAATTDERLDNRKILMPISRRTLALAVLAFLLAGGVALIVWHSSPVSRQSGPLTGAEIRELVSGNTVKGPKFSEYYAPDGSVRGREVEDEDEEYEGTWRIEGDQLCVAFPSHDYKGCAAITREPDGAYDFASDDRHSKRTIIAGSPDNL